MLAFPSTSFIATWSRSPASHSAEAECPHWRTWSELFSGSYSPSSDNRLVDWAALLVFALLFASTSAVMTVYLTSSERVFSTKHFYQVLRNAGDAQTPDETDGADANGYGPKTESPVNLQTEEGQPVGDSSSAGDQQRDAQPPRPRKVMYFAAGMSRIHLSAPSPTDSGGKAPASPSSRRSCPAS